MREYVAILDADDMWAPEKLDVQIPLFSGSEAVGVVNSLKAFLYLEQCASP